MFQHILLATDGSDASEHASTMAVNLAHTHGAKLTALYVADPYVSLGANSDAGFQAYMAATQRTAADAHAKANALCMLTDPPIQLQTLLIENTKASHGIVETAKSEDVDLIVVGSHGRSGIARLVLGSVADKVVAQSTVPVLVVR
jgi:nucleotide-binding universal stress UspA family protein